MHPAQQGPEKSKILEFPGVHCGLEDVPCMRQNVMLLALT